MPSTLEASEALEETTVWSFPERGSWNGHDGRYRGNWAPQIPRNLVLRYSKPGDIVLDQMMGGGTTVVEAWILGRRALGFDINPAAVARTKQKVAAAQPKSGCEPPIVEIGDARSLPIEPSTIDLIATHPPYSSMIRYSDGENPADLSALDDLNSFFEGLQAVARECFRVLKPGGHCGILMGDMRRRKHFVPLTTRTLLTFLEVGFFLREDAVKIQWNTRSERTKDYGPRPDFLFIAHERLFVFRKLAPHENAEDFQASRIVRG